MLSQLVGGKGCVLFYHVSKRKRIRFVLLNSSCWISTTAAALWKICANINEPKAWKSLFRGCNIARSGNFNVKNRRKKIEVVSQNRISLFEFIVGYLKGKKEKRPISTFICGQSTCRDCIEYALNTFRKPSHSCYRCFLSASPLPLSTLSIKKKQPCTSTLPALPRPLETCS